ALAGRLGQPVEIVELGRGGGARKRRMQVGVPQVDHAERELRLRPALAVEAGILEQPPRLLVAALLVELHRRIHRVVGRPCRAEEPRADDSGKKWTKWCHEVN